MQVTITTRHIDDPNKAENLRKYVSKKIKRLERYIKSQRNPSEVRLVLTIEKFRNIAEVIINSGRFKATSSVETEDMYTAIDRAVDGIIKQLRKQTDKKIKTKRRSVRSKEDIPQIELEPSPLINKEDIENITVEKVPPKPMSVEEAVLQLRVSDADFLTFHNSETGKVNVLYKRKGNKIGLITP
jgi:putative sigma-54 modulation protein